MLPQKKNKVIQINSLVKLSYADRVNSGKTTEYCGTELFDSVWDSVNTHLGTNAYSFTELVEQLGMMRFGHNPIIGDPFSGSGQIPFEAARLGCDTVASDLNPIACMLTWGAFNIVGSDVFDQRELITDQFNMAENLTAKIEELGIEHDGRGGTAKAFFYCLETRCPQTGWLVPMLPSFVVSVRDRVIAQLIPVPEQKRYNIVLLYSATAQQLKDAESGTITENFSYLTHTVDGISYSTKLSSIRGDYTDSNGKEKNKLRQWELTDIEFRDDDIFHERLYAIQWDTLSNVNGIEKTVTEFRAATVDDLYREQKVSDYVALHLTEWQSNGVIPNTRIETEFNTERVLLLRGWTHWHHLFNPRQLLSAAILNSSKNPKLKFRTLNALNSNCRLSRWNYQSNVAVKPFPYYGIIPLFSYVTRGTVQISAIVKTAYKYTNLSSTPRYILNSDVNKIEYNADIFITEPPYEGVIHET